MAACPPCSRPAVEYRRLLPAIPAGLGRQGARSSAKLAAGRRHIGHPRVWRGTGPLFSTILRGWFAFAFSARLLFNPEFAAHVTRMEEFATAVMASLESGFAEPEDEARSCRAVLSILDQIARTTGVADEGWQLIDRAFSEEERRLGIAP